MGNLPFRSFVHSVFRHSPQHFHYGSVFLWCLNFFRYPSAFLYLNCVHNPNIYLQKTHMDSEKSGAETGQNTESGRNACSEVNADSGENATETSEENTDDYKF